MTRMVQVALAEDVTEAEELQANLEVLMPELSFEAAQHAIEAMTDPGELVSDA